LVAIGFGMQAPVLVDIPMALKQPLEEEPSYDPLPQHPQYFPSGMPQQAGSHCQRIKWGWANQHLQYWQAFVV